jgi:general secretion pathway protein G
MMATTAILMIIASAIMPMARLANARVKEAELRRALRELRTAIELYRLYCEEGIASPNNKKIEPCRPPYPQKLTDLVEGKSYIGDVSGQKFKALRRLPRDPMTDSYDWGMRCYEDEPDSTSHCGANVWDVYTKSKRKSPISGESYDKW